MAYTTTELLAGIRRRARIADLSDFDDDTLLAMATEEQSDTVLARMQAKNPEFGVLEHDYTLVALADTLRIPDRALYGVIRSASRLSADEKFLGSLSYTDVNSIDSYAGTTGTPAMYAIQGDSMVLLPAPNTSGELIRIRYFHRPSELVPTSDCRQITGISGDRLTLTVATHTWTTASVLDLVDDSPSFGPLSIDLSPTSVTGTTLVFSTAVPDTVEEGDWVTVAETTPIPQLPAELHGVLAQAVAVKVAEQFRQLDVMQAAQAKLDRVLERATSNMVPRTKGSPTFLVPHYSPLRQRLRGWR